MYFYKNKNCFFYCYVNKLENTRYSSGESLIDKYVINVIFNLQEILEKIKKNSSDCYWWSNSTRLQRENGAITGCYKSIKNIFSKHANLLITRSNFITEKFFVLSRVYYMFAEMFAFHNVYTAKKYIFWKKDMMHNDFMQ